MSNLGMYQKIATAAKKVGGPYILVGITLAAGYLLIRPVEAIAKAVLKNSKNHKFKLYKDIETIYHVTADGSTENGFVLNIGDKFRVLAIDRDVTLIEKIGDPNNPYFVPLDFLRSISDFPAEMQME